MEQVQAQLHTAFEQLQTYPKSVQYGAPILLFLVVYGVYAFLARKKPWPQFPVVDLQEEHGLGPMKAWLFKGEKVIEKGRKQNPDTIFQVISGTGPKLMLPNKFAHELRNHPDLNFQEATAAEFFPTWPGFEAFATGLHSGNLIVDVVRVNLTQSLNLITDALVDETDNAMSHIFKPSKDWNNVKFKAGVLDMVARLSSRVFLGLDLCRNERWLEIAKDYTIHSFVAAMKLRFTPELVRPLGLLAFKECWQIRREYADAKKLISADIEKRKEIVRKAQAAGKKPPKTADTIGWMYEISERKNINADLVAAQLSLSLAAIHTTTEALLYALMDCCRNPEVVQPLREEVVTVLREYGWSKTSLYKLKLMDSFLKESQRLNVSSEHIMSRAAMKDITLSDGQVIPKGAKLNILTSYRDPTVYPEPDKFKADRFLEKRSVPGQENSWQHVTTSPEHMGFGHGQHACPGRFFATNELKIALCFMLLRYDFKMSAKGDDAPTFEGQRTISQDFELIYKSRQPEIDLMNLAIE